MKILFATLCISAAVFAANDISAKQPDPFYEEIYSLKIQGRYSEVRERLELVESSDPVAQVELANLYVFGLGAPEDLQKAREYLSAAADKGVPRAFHALSNFYLFGYGGARSLEVAEAYARRALVSASDGGQWPGYKYSPAQAHLRIIEVLQEKRRKPEFANELSAIDAEIKQRWNQVMAGDFSYGQYAAGETFARQGDYPSAVKWIAKGFAQEPSRRDISSWLVQLHNYDHQKTAMLKSVARELDLLFRRSSSAADVRTALSNIFSDLGQSDSDKSLLQRLLELIAAGFSAGLLDLSTSQLRTLEGLSFATVGQDSNLASRLKSALQTRSEARSGTSIQAPRSVPVTVAPSTVALAPARPAQTRQSSGGAPSYCEPTWKPVHLNGSSQACIEALMSATSIQGYLGAEPICKAAVSAAESRFPQSPEHASALFLYSLMIERAYPGTALGSNEAITANMKALEIRKKTLPFGDCDLSRSHIAVGTRSFMYSKYDECVKEIKAGLAMRLSDSQRPDATVDSAKKMLAQCQDKLN